MEVRREIGLPERRQPAEHERQPDDDDRESPRRRLAAALRESTQHLETVTVGKDRIGPYLQDLLDDAAGTAALINNQSQALDAILSSHENNVSARQNKDTRTISAFAALLALPTLIAGLYGMNFKNIPLVQWQYGWLVVGGAIIVVDIVIYLMFKRRHWL